MFVPEQLSLIDAGEEAALYHEYHTRRRGFFTLNQRDPEQIYQGYSRMKQSAYPLDKLPTVLKLLNPKIDTWISQGEFFRRNRRVVNLARIGLLFVDLDYYNIPAYEYAQPEIMSNFIQYELEVEGYPPPTIIISSGQGLQIKWIFEEPIPGYALPRWNACQSVLVNALKKMGADVGAKDASRILRVVNTVNTKSGELARVIHHDPSAIRSFEYLAENLLRYSRDEIKEFRDEAERRRARKKLKVVKSKKNKINGCFSNRQLAWHRLKDLQMLTQIRGGISEGHRMYMLFYQINFMLLSGATNSEQMWHEVRELARQIDPNWDFRVSELSTLYQKAKAHQNGETVTFRGKKYSPLYTPKNATLISLFEITSSEEARLRTIISISEAANRRRKRQRVSIMESRRRNGVKPRSEFESEAAERASQAREMRASGMLWARVGEVFGISAEAARKLADRHTP